ncbi:hypothetical protein ACXYMX_10975 [Sporosarcina sp. CAU 1771]
MEVFSLTGISGTGKSSSALNFAHKHQIPAIIDDGLLIINGEKIAGTSAKFEKLTLTAVKRAIFFDEQHATEVRLALENASLKRILLLGTSDKMVRIIAERLQIGKILHYYHIEEVRSSSEIKIAEFVRKTQGKHLIPISHQQVEQKFFSKLIQRGKDIFSSNREIIGKTTIVRPDFHKGTITISGKVFESTVSKSCDSTFGIIECHSVYVELNVLPTVFVVISISPSMSTAVLEIAKELQSKIHDDFIRFFEIELHSINVSVRLSTKKRKHQ